MLKSNIVQLSYFLKLCLIRNISDIYLPNLNLLCVSFKTYLYIRYIKDSNTTKIFDINQHVFSPSHLHVSTIYGHHYSGTQEGSTYILNLRIETTVLYTRMCIQYIHTKFDGLGNEDGKNCDV